MRTSTNTELLEFFKWWLQEAESEAPSWVVTTLGLCWNATEKGVYNALNKVLRGIYRDHTTPFGGGEVFYKESTNETLHLNPERIAFVKSQIERLENLNGTI